MKCNNGEKALERKYFVLHFVEAGVVFSHSESLNCSLKSGNLELGLSLGAGSPEDRGEV